jgi:dUTP pyrophosphatase
VVYVRVFIGRRKGEEKSLFGTFDSPPKVVCQLERVCVACGNKGFIWITGLLVVWWRMDRDSGIGLRQGEAMGEGTVEAVRIKVLKLDPAAQLPRYAHTGPFGDLAADLYAVAGATLAAGATTAVATGVAMEFPSTHGALVEDRSGLAMRGVTTLAGVIDPGYRGEIKVVMTNLGAAAVEIQTGDRIAQLRIVRRIEAEFDEVSELVEAVRGAKGFGSTGS